MALPCLFLFMVGGGLGLRRIAQPEGGLRSQAAVMSFCWVLISCIPVPGTMAWGSGERLCSLVLTTEGIFNREHVATCHIISLPKRNLVYSRDCSIWFLQWVRRIWMVLITFEVGFVRRNPSSSEYRGLEPQNKFVGHTWQKARGELGFCWGLPPLIF